MAEELLITRRRSIAGLFLDATVEERYQSKATVTQNPVEFGASMSDHAIILPDKYVVTGRVSDTPMREVVDDPWNAGDAETRSKSAWEILKELKSSREPFIIESGLQRYDNMLIETLTAQQNAEKSNVLDFTAECTQVIIVSTQEAVIDFPEPGETEDQAVPKVDRGDVQTETPEDEVEKSMLFKLRELKEAEDGS